MKYDKNFMSREGIGAIPPRCVKRHLSGLNGINVLQRALSQHLHNPNIESKENVSSDITSNIRKGNKPH
jgi:hypothetical protein